MCSTSNGDGSCKEGTEADRLGISAHTRSPTEETSVVSEGYECQNIKSKEQTFLPLFYPNKTPYLLYTV